MRLIKKFLGEILRGIAKVIGTIIDSLVQLIENMVLFVGSFFKGCLALMSMGGCLFFLIFANLGFRILMNSMGLSILLFLLVFLMFGGKFVSYLKYLKYITTEFLYNTANYLIDGTNHQYKAFNEYKAAYKKAEEDKIREQQRRYYEQQRKWEEGCKQQWYQQNHQSGQRTYGGYSNQGSYGHSFVNPTVEFKNRYERSCDILGVAYDADKTQIKSAYRKKAKEYHPDLCKAPNATKIFQEITAAYEFLSDDNIQQYKNIN
ncbi:chaperone protein DnaJ [Clostridium aceticum]|uniref:Chaperone protein DnaJ n=1 Tax=Clostridium aceticum TaxID=84022 RepID=A0A0D8I5V3_9CLOT|nr:DnaJ domain-containing protein [Clostridium aceticum]AKL96998.1 chaperone protein DnaJ [Clostridium aceticum]KJF25628.1 molecular chaperone DnaJ [Clostridium aceticum]